MNEERSQQQPTTMTPCDTPAAAMIPCSVIAYVNIYDRLRYDSDRTRSSFTRAFYSFSNTIVFEAYTMYYAATWCLCTHSLYTPGSAALVPIGSTPLVREHMVAWCCDKYRNIYGPIRNKIRHMVRSL